MIFLYRIRENAGQEVGIQEEVRLQVRHIKFVSKLKGDDKAALNYTGLGEKMTQEAGVVYVS